MEARGAARTELSGLRLQTLQDPTQAGQVGAVHSNLPLVTAGETQVSKERNSVKKK